MRQTEKNESLVSLIMSKTILDENSVGNLCGGQLTVVFNTESIWHYRRNETYRRFVTECQNIAIDGVGLLLALRLKGHRVHRYHGPDLCNDILVRGPSREQQVLIVGGNPANDTLATKGLVQGFLPLPIVNSTEDFESVFADLERFFLAFCGQKVVLVSLGLPKQELFCSWLLKRLESSRSLDKDEFVLLPVGA